MPKKTLILNQKEIIRLVDVRKAIKAVETAFKEQARGKTQMPSKIYLDLKKHNGDFRAMPSYIEGLKASSLKWVNVHPDNIRKGLPTVMAVVILSDPTTGFPLAIMDGTYLTSLRTAAAGGVAAKYCACKDSKVVGLVGCGVQAQSQLEALRVLFHIREVKVWGDKLMLAKRYVRKMKHSKENMTAVKTVKECVNDCDIIVTTTPSRKPLVRWSWLKLGAHINAIGADAKGKQELDVEVLREGKVIIDDWDQASHSGEINVAISRRKISRKNIYAQIGDIVSGRKKGRTNPKDVTIFDSTGLAIQDTAVAHLIYKTALRKRVGKSLQII